MARNVREILDEIAARTEEMDATVRPSLEKLHRLKLELAEACGHKRTTHEWAWTICLDCGIAEITAVFPRRL